MVWMICWIVLKRAEVPLRTGSFGWKGESCEGGERSGAVLWAFPSVGKGRRSLAFSRSPLLGRPSRLLRLSALPALHKACQQWRQLERSVWCPGTGGGFGLQSRLLAEAGIQPHCQTLMNHCARVALGGREPFSSNKRSPFQVKVWTLQQSCCASSVGRIPCAGASCPTLLVV